jgi:glycosyltransferase involved in cell wall biosynthesis
MKIAIVLHQFLPRYTTGTELYVSALATRLRGRGVEVVLFTGEDDERSLLAEHAYVHEGLTVWRFTHHRSLEPEPIRATYDSPLAAAAFGRFLDRVRPDAVHAFHLMGLGGGVLDAAYRRGIPYLVHLMDYWLPCPRTQMLDFEGGLCPGPRSAARCAKCAGEVDGSYRHLAESLAAEPSVEALEPRAEEGDPAAVRCLRDFRRVERRWPYLRERLLRAARLVSPSRYLRDRFAENGIEPGRIEFLPYGVDPGHDPGARPRIVPGRVRFGYLGNLATFKGAHLALEAFSRLEGPELRLAVHGDFFFREPRQMEACRAIVERDSRIEMKGPFPHRELGTLLGSLDAVIVPSLWHENTPFVVLEARQAGTPVIGSRVGGIEEVLRDGVDGLLFERGDVEDLARQLGRFAAGEVQLTGRPGALPTLEANVEALLALYGAAIAGRTEPDRTVVQRIEAGAGEDLFEVVEGLVERLDRLGSRSATDREIVAVIDRIGQLEADLEGHRNSIEEHVRLNERFREDVEKTEAHHREVVRTLQADLEGHRRALAELRRECEERRRIEAELLRDLEGHRAALGEREAQVLGLEQALASVRADLDGHREALDLAREEAERWRTAEAAWRETARELERVQEAFRAAEAAGREQARRIRALEAEVAVLLDEVDSTAQGRNL